MNIWNERPPMLTGKVKDDVQNLRDYLFRLSKTIEEMSENGGSGTPVSISYAKNGTQILKAETSAPDLSAVKKDIQDLKELLVQEVNELNNKIENGDSSTLNSAKSYTDQKTAIPVGYVLTTANSGDPATTYGGVWTLLDTATIGSTTVYYYQKTANSA